MAEHTFSDEAEFIYSLLLEHYDNGEIDDPAVLIESEEYKHTINIDAFEYGLNEFLKNNLISKYEGYTGGAFGIWLLLKCENMLKSGQKTLNSLQEKETRDSSPKVNITINGNVSGNNAIGAFQNTTVNMANNQIDFEKAASLVKSISENLQSIGLTESEKKSVSDSIEDIRSAIIRQDSNIIQTALKHIRDLCFNVAGNLLASGIVHQISSLLP